MNSILKTLLFLLLSNPIFAQMDANAIHLLNTATMSTTATQDIKALLKNYETALNASDTKQVLKLYAEDGIFMPSEAPTSIGTEAVGQAYGFVFSQIQLKIEFFIDEIEIEGNLAFARTISRGLVHIHANGIDVPEENRELFVFKKINGEWKIARYIFNKIKPAA